MAKLKSQDLTSVALSPEQVVGNTNTYEFGWHEQASYDYIYLAQIPDRVVRSQDRTPDTK